MLRPRLYPPRTGVSIDDNLLVRTSVCDSTRERIDSLSSALSGRRNVVELNRGFVACLRMASLAPKSSSQAAHNKDKYPSKAVWGDPRYANWTGSTENFCGGLQLHG